MPDLLSINGISRSFGADPLFQDLTLVVQEGARIGVIGRNGTGKSTFLKTLAGLEDPDSGEISSSGSPVISYVSQAQRFDADLSPREVLEQVAEGLGIGFDSRAKQIGKALATIELKDSGQRVGALSGGWQRRLAIACGLLPDPDILLLDEPTNHLDFSSILWLERLLQRSRFTSLIVTHDRLFLERVSSSIVELGAHYPQGYYRVKGGYTDFLEAREKYFVELERQHAALKAKVKEERAWMAKSPSARRGKARYRIQEAKRLTKKLDNLSQLRTQNTESFEFSASGRKTKELIECKKVEFGYTEDKPLISDFTFTLKEKMCVGVLGANGSGKSTLLKLFNKSLTPRSGRVRQAKNLRISLLDQMREALKPDITLREALTDKSDSVVYQGSVVHQIAWARRFRFDQDQLVKYVSDLSGGEKARLLLSHIVREETDVLMLDEPTNDLDIDMIELLEQSILNFQGSVVLISHDRYMMEEVCTHFIGILPSGEIGVFADYLQWESEFVEGMNALKQKKPREPKPKASKPKKLSYKEKIELEGMELSIEQAEAKLSQLLQTSERAHELSAEESKKLFEDIHAQQEQVAELYDRWEELEAKQSI